MQTRPQIIKSYTAHVYACSPYSDDAARRRPFPQASREAADSPAETFSTLPKPANIDQRVLHAIELMEHYLHQDLALDELSNHVNLSLWHLSHLFKSETGLPPAQYLRLLRLNKARELLESTFLNIKEIKNMVGIRDESHFTRNFKKLFGVTPAQHRALYLRTRARPSASPEALTETAKR